jgi:DNA-binding MarR family transcriptional regulator
MATRSRTVTRLEGDQPLEGAAELTDVVTRLRRTLRAGIRSNIAWESLPMAQVEILQTLAEQAPARVNDLAERLRLAQSTVSGLVGQMIHSGLVTRDVDPADRRAAVVNVSAKGVEQLGAWERAHVNWIRAALSGLTVEDRAAISAAIPSLRRLTDSLSETASSSG